MAPDAMRRAAATAARTSANAGCSGSMSPKWSQPATSAHRPWAPAPSASARPRRSADDPTAARCRHRAPWTSTTGTLGVSAPGRRRRTPPAACLGGAAHEGARGAVAQVHASRAARGRRTPARPTTPASPCAPRAGSPPSDEVAAGRVADEDRAVRQARVGQTAATAAATSSRGARPAATRHTGPAVLERPRRGSRRRRRPAPGGRRGCGRTRSRQKPPWTTTTVTSAAVPRRQPHVVDLGGVRAVCRGAGRRRAVRSMTSRRPGSGSAGGQPCAVMLSAAG